MGKRHGLLILLFLSVLLWSAGPVSASVYDEALVYVSVLPQKYLAERIGGDYVTVRALVGPGQSPATYDPSPKQMAELSRAQLYFRVGVPFEAVWMDKLHSINPQMSIVDTRAGIPLRNIESHVHEEDEGAVHAGPEAEAGQKDPHIWLSPRLAAKQAETMYQALVRSMPSHKEYFAANFAALRTDLDALDLEIRNLFSNVERRSFMVFHPSWGYFADEYHLIQIPIELQGKEPSARELSQLIRKAKDERIRTIVVQSQFSVKSANAVARAVGAVVVQLDPLAEDYMENLRRIAHSLREQLGN